MAASAIIAAIGLAVAIGSTAYGVSQQNKARKIKQSNRRPTYDITSYQKNNQQIAENLAGQGLPEETLQYYRQQSERGLSYGVDSILKGGGDNNMVSGLYGQYNDNLARLAVLDDQRRTANLAVLREQNRFMSNESDKAWQVNEYAPYADRAQEAQALYNSGSQYINQGISTGVNAIGNYAGGMSQNNAISRIENGGLNTQQMPSARIGVSPAPNVGNMPGPYANSYMYQPPAGYTLSRMTPEQQSIINGIYQRY